MPADIKSILDSIIDGTNNKIPNTVNSTLHQNMGVKTPETFDAGQFREKLSMYVLKDIICAMMHDDTKDLDSMIDQSIMKHIHDDYGCSCYDYLCKSRDKLNSPILSDIIQEIDERSMKIQTKVADETEDDATEDAEDMKKSLKDIENYDQLRQQLKEVVSKKVVNDVAKVITQSNDAPVFDKLDEKLTEKTTEEIPLEADDTTNESSILKMTGTIIAEGASYGIQIPYEDGMNAAIIEYCLCEMDYLFKMDPSMEIRRRWDASPTIQEGFFDIFKKKKTEPSEAGYIVIDSEPPIRCFLTDDSEATKSYQSDEWYPKGIVPQFHLNAEVEGGPDDESWDESKYCAMIGSYEDTGEYVVVIKNVDDDEIHVYSLETKSAEDVLKKFRDGAHISTSMEDIGDES